MFHFDTRRNMEEFIFDNSCLVQPEFCKTDRDEFNFELPTFLGHTRAWNDNNLFMCKDGSFMYSSDCSNAECFAEPEFDFFDSRLYEINEFSTLENEMSPITNVDVQTTAGYFNGEYSVGLDCFDDTQDIYGRINEPCKTFFNPMVSHFQENLQANDTEFFAPSLGDEDVYQILEMLEDENIKTICWGNKRTKSCCEDSHEIYGSQCSFYELKNEQNCAEGDSYNLQSVKRSGLKRKNEGKKDERYWIRRMKNNAAAKKSRAARKNRFSFLEKRIKVLEIENAEKKEFLRMLEQKLLEKQRK
ncbi:uncharacterized protein LOC114525848 [Dendronephthya gigantea]|uniref:uncharacterized protein LOC114525848 n=1 Tax=Dendronephthya gigantea TaxID=151771 RepID=UPI00106CE5E1|nr:uncharacterized protein LOC114525848 [Dendronephthya gigantea]